MSNLQVVLESVANFVARGWAVDHDDLDFRAPVELWVDGACQATMRADGERVDLKANDLGDGRYGFRFDLDSDVYLLQEDHDVAIEVRGRDVSGRVVPCSVSPDALTTIGSRICVPESSVAGAIIYGQSGLTENIREYHPAFVSSPKRRPTRRRDKKFLAIQMYGFGDFMWWEHIEGTAHRTARRYFSGLGRRTCDALRSGTMGLLLDMSNEGPSPVAGGVWLGLLHDELARLQIPAGACTFVSQNLAFAAFYGKWCDANGQGDRMHVAVYDFYLDRLAGLLSRAPFADMGDGLSEAPRGKTYLCMNFTPRESRVYFLAWLFGAGLTEDALISFAGLKGAKWALEQPRAPDGYPEGHLVTKGLEQLAARGVISLDLDSASSRVPEFDLGPASVYRDTLFSIVTESETTDGDVLRLTEKTLKPLAMGHPLLIVGNPHSLARLRSLGFRTFSGFLDETYDVVESTPDRLRLLQQEVRRLLALSDADWREGLASLRQVLAHNYRHARGGLSALYGGRLLPELMQSLLEGAAG